MKKFNKLKEAGITACFMLCGTVMSFGQKKLSTVSTKIGTEVTEVMALANQISIILFIAGGIGLVAVFFFKKENIKQSVIAYVGAMIVWSIVNAVYGAA